MVSKQKKWFKSAFAEPTSIQENSVQQSTSKRTKVEKAFRSISESDSINLTEFVSDWDASSKQSTTTQASEDIFNAAAEPVQMIYTDFKSSNWIENFAPRTKTDLAIHVKKIAELEDWFTSIQSEKSNRSAPILLITGPSGCGKTATVKMIANEFGFGIVEWVTPLDVEHVRHDKYNQYNENVTYTENQSDKFSQFLFQSSRYRSVFDTSNKRLVLVKDFPNVFIKDPTNFEEVLEQYSVYGKAPLIFIITDTKSRTLNIGYTLFSDVVRQRFCIKAINFNCVSDTMIKKGLKRICDIMMQPGFITYYTEPQKDVIESIVLSSQGDIRNAVINLHFASQKNSVKLSIDSQNGKAETSAASKKSKNVKKNKLKSLGCDENMTVLHALGRVFNPKYNDTPDSQGNKTFVHTPDDIAGVLTAQPSTMIDLIHTNYVGHFQSIDDIVNAADVLSHSDVILNEWRSDLSCEIALNVAVRGIMVTNDHPVSGRWMPIRSAKNNLKSNYAHEKECKDIGIGTLVSSNVLASDYRNYMKIIPPPNLNS